MTAIAGRPAALPCAFQDGDNPLSSEPNTVEAAPQAASMACASSTRAVA